MRAILSSRPGVVIFLLITSLVSLWAAEAGPPGVLSLRIFPQGWTVLEGGTPLNEYQRRGEIRDYRLSAGEHTLILTAPAHRPRIIRVVVEEGSLPGVLKDPGWDRQAPHLVREEKLEPFGTSLRLAGMAATGSQPKSVEFLGDSPLAAVALLNGPGVEIFSTENGALVKEIIIPEPYGSAGGFVESVYLPGRRELWVSQMNTSRVHVIDGDSFTWLGSVPTGGGWPKVVTASRDEKYLFASNWLGENIGVIDLENRRLSGTIPVTGIPRGMAFGSDDSVLYVCIYGTGNIEKVDVNRRASLGILPTGPGAARHIVYDPGRRIFYVSDMLTGRVYSLSEKTGRVENSLRIGPNLNTIKLSDSGDYLFISSRGRNNSETYLRKGPDFGTVTVLDTRDFTLAERIYGGNQPTGLAVWRDILVFSDFKDDRLELYRIPGLE